VAWRRYGVDLDRGREREGEGEERGEGGWRGVLGAAGGAGDTEERGSLHKNTMINKNKIQYNYVFFKSRYKHMMLMSHGCLDTNKKQITEFVGNPRDEFIKHN